LKKLKVEISVELRGLQFLFSMFLAPSMWSEIANIYRGLKRLFLH